jgi:hypothetical protein
MKAKDVPQKMVKSLKLEDEEARGNIHGVEA